MFQGNSLASFLTGLFIGSAVGVYLYATKEKGVRKGIVRKTRALADQLNERIEEGKSVLSNLQKKTTEAKNKVTRAVAPTTR